MVSESSPERSSQQHAFPTAGGIENAAIRTATPAKRRTQRLRPSRRIAHDARVRLCGDDSAYSPEYVEEEFCELRQGFIGNSSLLASVVAWLNGVGLSNPDLLALVYTRKEGHKR